jgi:pimeloyl-ACP methyl ester carboxylesterase
MRVDFEAVFAAFARVGGPASRPIGRSPNNEQGALDFRADLARVRCLTSVIGGDRDPVTPIQFAETIAAPLPPPDALGRLRPRAMAGRRSASL